jgi:peptidyl-prolyl cis-trans isomerase B (cyclophilin B)
LLKSVVCSLTVPLVLIVALGGASAAPNPYVQIVQLEESRSLGNGRLADFLSSKDRSLALRAALAIGRTKQPAGIPLLERHAGDRDAAMRAMAVYGMGLIGTSRTAKSVLAALDDTSDVVRVSALDATDRLQTAHDFTEDQQRRAGRQVAALLHAHNDIVRARAATAAESFHTSVAQQQVLVALRTAYYGEPSAFVRWHMMWTLFRAYAKDVPQSILRDGLKDADETVRIEAVRGFGRRGDRSAVSLLQPLLRDPSWRVREQTLESITVLRGGKMTEHLTKIPAGVQTPAPVPDRLAYLPALPRTAEKGKPQRPAADGIILQPTLQANTVATFAGPAKGPHPRVRIVTTEGNVYVELYPEWAPLTVENFLNLTNRGYYDNNPWFRIVPDFVVQTGDPTGNGNGDAGYMIPAEENPIEQDSYVISMGLNYTDPPNAHAIRDSAGTQFYITLSPQLHLNRDFTVFGKVVSGFDVLGRLIESDKIVRVERLPDTKP